MRIPCATYRVQFNQGFRFSDAEDLVPYLDLLGISDLYSSPKDKARRGSLHGYDVTNPMQINSELGDEEEFARLLGRLRRHGMGLLLDIVPNHMAASDENPWWMDVLENGRVSPYAHFFDIDWDAPESKAPEFDRNRVVVPLLPDVYGRVLLNRGIRLRFGEKGFFAEAESTRLPLSPGSYPALLESALARMRPQDAFGAAEAIRAVAAELPTAPARDATAPGQGAEAERVGQLKRRLWRAYQESPNWREALEATLDDYNGVAGDEQSFAKLDAVLRQQSYRLAYWRTATGEINYRRFFDINDLIALRVEDLSVFNATHSHILPLVAQGKLAGLRIDHVDGLRDPQQYLERLAGAPNGGQKSPRAPDAADAAERASPNVYIVVEKITSGAEALPSAWPVAGTTGYDFLNAVNTLLVDPDGARQLEAIYQDFAGIRASFSETWYVRKRQVMEELFGADIRVLSSRLARLAAMDRFARDVPLRELIRGLKEITARLAVYRTYFRSLELAEHDRASLAQAVRIARERTPPGSVSEDAFDFLERLFLLRPFSGESQEPREWLDFLLRWQQFTSAVMAKGFEDTAFYVHHGLISLNEVGCNPFRRQMRFGVHGFHHFNAARQKTHPHSLNATSTHDTKWSEDVRARVNVLSEMPREWQAHLARWSRLNEPQKPRVEGRAVPSANEEVLIYQSLLGIWPLSWSDEDAPELRERLGRYILKASREAKTHTRWVSPNQAHEAALGQFVAAILDCASPNPFLREAAEFARNLAFFGACNSFSQALLKITAPGVPDFFQGTEVWRFSLTDPDNRRPVDFARRAALLSAVASELEAQPEELLRHWQDGRIKLFLTQRALRFRRANAALFANGGYVPLRLTGPKSECLCAFARPFEGAWTITAVPRLLVKAVEAGQFPLGRDVWDSERVILPAHAPRVWHNVFTGELVRAELQRRTPILPVANLFNRLPFCLLAGGR